jgi:hypothetical protein
MQAALLEFGEIAQVTGIRRAYRAPRPRSKWTRS